MHVEIPTLIHLYNRSMGSVDLNYQYGSYYPSGRSGKKWWRFIFWFGCVNLQCVNSGAVVSTLAIVQILPNSLAVQVRIS